MISIIISGFVLICYFDKNHDMIDMRCLKNVIFFQTILRLVLSRKVKSEVEL